MPKATKSKSKRGTVQYQPYKSTQDRLRSLRSTPLRMTLTPIQPFEHRTYPRLSFLGLPTELRDEVYHQLFDCKDYSDGSNLLRTCRQVYHEASNLALAISIHTVEAGYWSDTDIDKSAKFKLALEHERRLVIDTIRIFYTPGLKCSSPPVVLQQLQEQGAVCPTTVIIEPKAVGTLIYWAVVALWQLEVRRWRIETWVVRDYLAKGITDAARCIVFPTENGYHWNLVRSENAEEVARAKGYFSVIATNTIRGHKYTFRFELMPAKESGYSHSAQLDALSAYVKSLKRELMAV